MSSHQKFTLRLEYTASALIGADYRAKIKKAQVFCQRHGWIFGIQIHNVTPMAWIERLAESSVPLSFHAPVASEYFMNLASRDPSGWRDSRERTASVMKKYGSDLAVFHGFLMTDEPILIFNEARGYVECMSQAYRKELSRPGLKLCGDFMGSEEFRLRLDRVKENLRELNRNSAGITWCIENDYPLFGAGLLLAEPMVALDSPLCLDISHLWASSLLFDRPFHEEVEQLARSGLLRCVHLHANPIRPGTRLEDFRDGHLPLGTGNEMDLPRVVRTLVQHQVDHFVIETSLASRKDLEMVGEWIDI